MFKGKNGINLLLAVLLCAVSVSALCIGRYTMNPLDVFRSAVHYGENSALDTVIWSVRLPRIIMAAAVGSGLSVAGLSLQAMFGNPLVSAHVLGVSYSAGFGAALGILLFSNFAIVETSSLLFGLVGMALTYRLSKRKGGRSTLTLVLSGIIVGAAFEALTSLIKFVADPESKLPTITYWLMGSMSGASYKTLLLGLPFIVTGTLIIFALRWRLNILSLNEDEARSMGMNIRVMRFLVIVASSLITASAVSMCGSIGWVGLLVPHMARMLMGSNNRTVIPISISLGSVFVIVIDTFARSMSAAEIPISILTAVIGAPFFIALLRKTGGSWT